MRKTFFDALLKLAKRDKKIYLITSDVGYGCMDNFKNELPKQFINAGISEQHAVTMAAGMASCGLKPIVCSITPFLILKATEQIKLDIVYNNNKVILVGIGRPEDYADAGITHQCPEDTEILKAIAPNMQVFAPQNKKGAESLPKNIMNLKQLVYVNLRKKEWE